MWLWQKHHSFKSTQHRLQRAQGAWGQGVQGLPSSSILKKHITCRTISFTVCVPTQRVVEQRNYSHSTHISVPDLILWSLASRMLCLQLDTQCIMHRGRPSHNTMLLQPAHTATTGRGVLPLMWATLCMGRWMLWQTLPGKQFFIHILHNTMKPTARLTAVSDSFWSSQEYTSRPAVVLPCARRSNMLHGIQSARSATRQPHKARHPKQELKQLLLPMVAAGRLPTIIQLMQLEGKPHHTCRPPFETSLLQACYDTGQMRWQWEIAKVISTCC